MRSDPSLDLMMVAAVEIGFGGSLRGHEIFYADLHGMRKHLLKGKHAMPAVGSHLLVALLGQFKGETGECYHLTTLALETDLGLQIRHWIMMLIFAWDMQEVRHWPLFQEMRGGVVYMGQLDAIMHCFL